MKLKSVITQNPAAALACAAVLMFSVSAIPINRLYALTLFAAFIILSLMTVLLSVYHARNVRKTIRAVQRSMDFSDYSALGSFPLPMLVGNAEGQIVWYNELFSKWVLSGGDAPTGSITQFTSGMSLDEINCRQMIYCEYANKKFSVFINHLLRDSDSLYVLYYVDDTELKQIAEDYDRVKPFVMFLKVDNAGDLHRRFSDGDIQFVTGEIQNRIEHGLESENVVFRKLSSGRYMVIGEQGVLKKLMDGKFSVLTDVRELTYMNTAVGCTLSAGAGIGSNIAESEKYARAALDLAEGRGGDQAVIRDGDEYSFFGGVSGGVEKHSRAGVRKTSLTLCELLSHNKSILIMGHKFSDFDSVGAAYAVYRLASVLGSDARIAVSPSTTLASPLISEICAANPDREVFIEPHEAIERFTTDTLVCVVDTHRAEFTEVPELFERALKTAVIDHHRRTVDCIDSALLFFHEPSASSTCEMMSELLTYSKVFNKPDRLTAEALLAGIVLDTKEFVLRSGARTFEAAAYLKDCGADTVMVKKLFSSSPEEGALKNRVLSTSKLLGEYAFAICAEDTKYTRLACAKAADELLELENVKASFVIFLGRNSVNISARSLGEVNVQVIMEKFGGGGHSTMAAAQLKDETIETVLGKLTEILIPEGK